MISILKPICELTYSRAEMVTEWRQFSENGRKYKIRATVQFDDSCRNGHQTFSITGEIYELRGRWCERAFGRLVEEIETHFPELRHLMKWHLCSTDGPLHYVANTMYFIKNGKLDAARKSAVWANAADSELLSDGLISRLEARLPSMMKDFRAAVESIGFTWMA